MKVTAYEGVVRNGHIHLISEVRLPDNARVFVVFPELEAPKVAQIPSPRLAHPGEAVDFEKRIVETPSDATV